MFAFQTKIENLKAQSLSQEQMDWTVQAPLNPPTDGTFSIGFIILSNPGSVLRPLKQPLLNNITPRMYF